MDESGHYDPGPPDARTPDGLIPSEPVAYAVMLRQLCDSVASGGTLADFGAMRCLGLQWMNEWLDASVARRKAYDKALAVRSDYLSDRMLAEATGLALAPLPEYDTETGRKVGGVDARDKLKAIEMVGREVGRFRPSVDVTGSITIGPILDRARARVAANREGQNSTKGTVDRGGGGDFGRPTPTPSPLANNFRSPQFPPAGGSDDGIIIDAL